MPNQLLTIGMITRKAVQLFRNSNGFLKAIDRQYDDQFARTGAKIGATLKIRLPNDYTLRTGATANPQNTVEQYTNLTVATQIGVDVSFSSVDRALSLDDYSERVLAPAINVVAGGIAADVMSLTETIPNLTHAVDGSNNTLSPTMATWLNAQATLDLQSAPRDRRCAVLDPLTMGRTVNSFSVLFNNQQKVGKQYSTGMVGTDVLGMDWYEDQTVIKHATAAYGTLGTVAGANQTGTAITTSALNGPLNAGDIVTFAGVYAVNRVTKASTGTLRQFVVTANVASAATSIPIYPALIGQVAGANVAFQTVTASPANLAAIASPVNASETYRKNFVFHPRAFTLVTADLELPRGVHEAARENYDGISMRMVTAYNVTTDQFITRLDLLYGYAFVRPEWAVVVADSL